MMYTRRSFWMFNVAAWLYTVLVLCGGEQQEQFGEWLDCSGRTFHVPGLRSRLD